MPSDPLPPFLDRRRVRDIIRNFDEAQRYALLAEWIERLPDAEVHAMLRRFADEREFLAEAPQTPTTLLDEVRRLDRETRAGHYFDEFFVTSHNYGDRSAGTMAFAAELNRLADRCVAAPAGPADPDVHAAVSILVDLLGEVQRRQDELVFVSDDSGIRAFRLDVDALLRAWFAGLASRTPPDEFAAAVVDSVLDLGFGMTSTWDAANACADAAQRAALARRLG